jgi:hypothetical protein
MKLHRKATIYLIGLFESGYQTVTVCTDAVLSFQSVREACTISAVFSALQTAAVDFNIGMLLDAAKTTAIPRNIAIGAGATPAISSGQIIFSAVRTYQTEQQRKKWATSKT